MILSKTNSWMREELLSHKEIAPRYCYIQDIVNVQDRRFFISDGIYFIKSTMPQESFLGLTKRYNQDSLQLKGSIILVKKHIYTVERDSGIEMVLEDCVYLGEGDLNSETKDINEIVDSRSLFLTNKYKDGKQSVGECIPTTFINDVSKNRILSSNSRNPNILSFNSPSKHEKYLKYSKLEENTVRTEMQPLCEAKVFKFIESKMETPTVERKKPFSKQPITESFIMSIDKVGCNTEDIIDTSQIKDLQMISIGAGEPSDENYLSHVSSIRSSCLMRELFEDSMEINDKEEESFNFSDISSFPAVSNTSRLTLPNRTKSTSSGDTSAMPLCKDIFEEIQFIRKEKSHRRHIEICLAPMNKLNVPNYGTVHVNKRTTLTDSSNRPKRNHSKFMGHFQTESTDSTLSQAFQKVFKVPKVILAKGGILNCFNGILSSQASSERIVLRRRKRNSCVHFPIKLNKIRIKRLEDAKDPRSKEAHNERSNSAKKNKYNQQKFISHIKGARIEKDIGFNERTNEEHLPAQDADLCKISFMRRICDLDGCFRSKRSLKKQDNQSFSKLSGEKVKLKETENLGSFFDLFFGVQSKTGLLMHQKDVADQIVVVTGKNSGLFKLIGDGCTIKYHDLASRVEDIPDSAVNEDRDGHLNADFKSDASITSTNLEIRNISLVSRYKEFFRSKIDASLLADKILESPETAANSSISFQKMFFPLPQKQLPKTGRLEPGSIKDGSVSNIESSNEFKQENLKKGSHCFKSSGMAKLPLPDASENPVSPLYSDCEYPDFMILMEDENAHNYIDFLTV